jgi:hypothetical protein
LHRRTEISVNGRISEELRKRALVPIERLALS